MLRQPVLGLVLVAAVCVAVGCAGEVNITHTLPAAVPLPEGVRPLRAGDVSMSGFSKTDLSPMVGKALGEELARINRSDANNPAGMVDAEIDITVADTHGTRTVRRGQPDSGMKTATLATLVRKVTVRAEFPVRRKAGAEPIVTLSVMRTYDSRRDPRVWGELALGRAGDPNRVPSSETILRELLHDCVRRGADLLRQGQITATVPLKDTWNTTGRRGIDAMKRGEYIVAADRFADALRDHPTDPALRFNHAVACEAAGRLRPALMDYRKVLDDHDDPHALAGAQRVQTVISHRENALPGGVSPR